MKTLPLQGAKLPLPAQERSNDKQSAMKKHVDNMGKRWQPGGNTCARVFFRVRIESAQRRHLVPTVPTVWSLTRTTKCPLQEGASRRSAVRHGCFSLRRVRLWRHALILTLVLDGLLRGVLAVCQGHGGRRLRGLPLAPSPCRTAQRAKQLSGAPGPRLQAQRGCQPCSSTKAAMSASVGV